MLKQNCLTNEINFNLNKTLSFFFITFFFGFSFTFFAVSLLTLKTISQCENSNSEHIIFYSMDKIHCFTAENVINNDFYFNELNLETYSLEKWI